MEALRQLVAGKAAGQKLLAALEPLAKAEELAALITAVLQERAPAAPSNDQPAANPRASLDEAACVIPGLTFVTPRCGGGRRRALDGGSASSVRQCMRSRCGGALPTRLQQRRRSSNPRPAPVCRGKHELAFFADSFLVKTAKADISVPYSAIRHLAVSGAGRRLARFLGSARPAQASGSSGALSALSALRDLRRSWRCPKTPRSASSCSLTSTRERPRRPPSCFHDP